MSYWKYSNDKPVLPEGYENETEWHALWKFPLNDKYCEVVCGDNNEHRADIKTDEFVIELQKSNISFQAVKERTDFYHDLTGCRVIWVINAYSSWKHIETELDNESKWLIVKWKYAKKWVVDICGWNNNHIYLDISPKAQNLLRIWKHDDIIYGKWEKKNDFFAKYLAKYSRSVDDFSSMFRKLDVSDY